MIGSRAKAALLLALLVTGHPGVAWAQSAATVGAAPPPSAGPDAASGGKAPIRSSFADLAAAFSTGSSDAQAALPSLTIETGPGMRLRAEGLSTSGGRGFAGLLRLELDF